MDKTILQSLTENRQATEQAIHQVHRLINAHKAALVECEGILETVSRIRESIDDTAEVIGYIPRQNDLPRRTPIESTGPHQILT